MNYNSFRAYSVLYRLCVASLVAGLALTSSYCSDALKNESSDEGSVDYDRALSFVVEPATEAQAGVGLGHFAVKVKSLEGAAPAAAEGQTVEVTIRGQDGGLAGTTSVPVKDGMARFHHVVIETPGQVQLEISVDGAEPMVTKTITVHPNPKKQAEPYLVSRDANGAGGDGDSLDSMLNADGRYIAFSNDSLNLTTGDENAAPDVFLFDRETGQTEPASVGGDGELGNAASSNAVLSSCARYIAYESDATNLVDGDTNGVTDVYFRDRHTKTTSRISISAEGVEPNAASLQPSISGCGAFVAFASAATNLVSEDTRGSMQVYIKDQMLGTLTLVSRFDGEPGEFDSVDPALSPNADEIAFSTSVKNFIGRTRMETMQLVLVDLKTGQSELVSRTPQNTPADGSSSEPAISRGGQYVVFSSEATDLTPVANTHGGTEIFLYNRENGTITWLSRPNEDEGTDGPSYHPSISDNGRYVAWESKATNLVPGDANGSSDMFVHDRESALTVRATVDADGNELDGDCIAGRVSNDGRFVTYQTVSDAVPSAGGQGVQGLQTYMGCNPFELLHDEGESR